MTRIQETLVDMYRLGPELISPQEVMEKVKEYMYDPQLFSFLVDTMQNWDVLSGVMGGTEGRTRSVQESRNLYRFDVTTAHVIDLWTDFGFGIGVDISARDEQAQEVWEEFWAAQRNIRILGQRKLHTLSTKVLVDGEFFFVFFTKKSGDDQGRTTIRIIPQDEISEIIVSREDDSSPLYYQRRYTPKGSTTEKVLYYRDWLAGEYPDIEDQLTDEQVRAMNAPGARAEDIRDDVDVVMMHVAFNVYEKDGRGRPLMSRGGPWARVYQQFLQDRAAVVRAVATFVDKVKADTGQRGIDALRNRLSSTIPSGSLGIETNPPPPPGSTWLENEAVTRTRMPLGTGGGDAFKDGSMLIGQVAMAGRIFPHYLGYGDAYRLATATAMEKPVLRVFERYQSFWASVWTDVVFLVLTQFEQFTATKIDNKSSDISLDNIIEVPLESVLKMIDEIQDMLEKGMIEVDSALSIVDHLVRVALQTLGIRDVDSVMNPEREEMPGGEPDEADLANLQTRAEEIEQNIATTMNWLKGLAHEAVKERDGTDNGA